jgi:hypothetical protein
VKYKQKAVTTYLIKEILDKLQEKFSFPFQILQFDYERHENICFKGAVWDVEKGTILKLAEGSVVMHAVRGFQ